MKNNTIQNIILGVLAVGVLGLYILHFTQPKKAEVIEKEEVYVPKKVVFINTDSFFDNYNEYKAIEKRLKSSQESAEKNIANKMKAIENDYMKLMQDAQAGKINMQDAQAKEKSLINRKTALEKESQNTIKSLASKSENETKNLYKKLREYFDENKEKYNADFVMGYQTTGMLLYYNPENDITSQVVADLNKSKK